MSQLYISPSEPQYGLRRDFATNNALVGVSMGNGDFIVEILVKTFSADVALTAGTGLSNPYYLLYADAGAANYFLFYQVLPGQIRCLFTGANLFTLNIGDIFHNNVHMFFIFRELSFAALINGHELRTGAKAAHNINATWVRLFASALANGLATPSVGCMCRIYNGDLSGFTTAQLLTIHRKYLRTPMITPLELTAYEVFRFRGRRQDGSSILAGDTNIYNEINDEALPLVNGNFGAGRHLIWQPR